MQSTVELKPTNLPAQDLAFTNEVYTNPVTTFALFDKEFGLVKINGHVFTLRGDDRIDKEAIALGRFTREFARISLARMVRIDKMDDSDILATGAKLEITVLQKSGQVAKIKAKGKDLETLMVQHMKGKYINKTQPLLLDFESNILSLKVVELNGLDSSGTASEVTSALIDSKTEFDFKLGGDTRKIFELESDKLVERAIFRTDFNSEKLGIGGLDTELGNIFRRAFASRRFPPSTLKKYGISHVKGVLLFGPPGTGKTLIARKLSEALDAKEPKIINGPEVFDKYVGGSEEKIRELFVDAEHDEAELGEESPLHVIIFDEIDAICKQRGSTNSGTGVHDSVVNQLLSKIDGVNSLNNVLIVGMTNRKDLMDEAILRPGRLEVHIEISLPNEEGREQIFRIHTACMRENDLLSGAVNLGFLAAETKNYTGAEIESVVKSAASFSFQRGVDPDNNFKSRDISVEEKKVSVGDFNRALAEVKPQFGVDAEDLAVQIPNGITSYGPSFDDNVTEIKKLLALVKTSEKIQNASLLLEGETGTGKTALAAHIAQMSEFPYIKFVSAKNYIGFSDAAKIGALRKVFDDAYKSPLSLVILDELERLIEYTKVGYRFSNPILQALLVLIKQLPNKAGRKIMVVATTSCASHLADLELTSIFNFTVTLTQLQEAEEKQLVLNTYNCGEEMEQKLIHSTGNVGIKQFLLDIEMELRPE